MGQRSEVNKMRSEIIRLEKKLAKLHESEARARAIWTRQYHAYQKSSDTYIDLKNVATIKANRLRERIRSWPTRSVELTQKRDSIRNEINETTNRLLELNTILQLSVSKSESLQAMHNEIVDQVFALSSALSQAYQARDSYLSQHVFPYLVDINGKLRSQITFINSDQTRKITAMVNSISSLEPTLASQAQDEIEKFFDRYQMTDMDKNAQTLYDLTQRLLTEKRTFKVGETLYRFLTMKLTKKSFPELVRAQDLLKSALRSEKTNSYVRIYQRSSSKDRWEQVRIG